MATTQQMLDEALEARHKLVIGKQRVSVGFGERRVEYTAANLSALDAYIAELRRTLAGKKPVRSRLRYVVPD